MASATPQIFNGIDPERYARLVNKARSAGISIDGNSGTAAKFGVEVAWNYEPEAKQLTFQCIKTPFFMKAADVQSRIQSLVEETLTVS